jgi:hypothetical protein
MFYLQFFTRSMKAGKRLRVKNGGERRDRILIGVFMNGLRHEALALS